MTPLQKLPKNVRDFDKLIVAKDFKKLPKDQEIVQSGHTACEQPDSSFCHNRPSQFLNDVRGKNFHKNILKI